MTYSFEEYSKLFQAVKEVRTSEVMKYDVGSNEYDKAAIVREVVHFFALRAPYCAIFIYLAKRGNGRRLSIGNVHVAATGFPREAIILL